ncbi:TonB-dependent receptor [Sphingomonas sp. R-74633]|uniref:TonB-dependent receptor n=1 Tax=Sphingomonas sp. R-74633 TaxID=2751188 RepID=UPI0015D1ECC8|nr:TonB-dependent receptor [Sphingomonas sp. R-74633]NYT42035.1 TonB-dependent receptor [Sphingomonas sp. R-74633]
MKIQKTALFLGAAFSALMIGGTAQAQDTSTNTTTANDGPETEIVVTAERRPETLQNTPVSVGVIGGQDARDFTAAGDDTLLALSGKVPSFYAETTTGRIFPRFYIRGLGNIDFYLGASQPVSIIQDDVVLEHVVLKSNPVYDLDHVEVLRGPQGSLFGRNTTAGIVKFDTVRPSLDGFDARGQLSYGSYNSINLDAGIGGPIADNVAIRVSGLFQHRDDYVDNTYSGASADGTKTPRKNAMGGFDERDARIQLLVKPTEDWTSLFSAHVRNYNGTSTLFLRQALKKGSNDVSNVSRTTVRFDEAMDNPQDYDTYGMSWNNAFDFGPVTLTSITAYETSSGYSRGDTDGGAAADFPVGGVANGFGQSMGRLADLDQWTQELRLSSNGDGAFKWQVGGMYFDSRDITEFYQRAWFLNGTARNPNNWVRLHDVNTSWALFGQASYQVTPKFRLTAGVRVTEDTKTTDLLKTADTALGAVTYPGRRHVRLSDTQPSWDVSALYEVSNDLSLYARVARGFRGPTIQGRSAVFNSDFTTANSETILSYEAGLKSSLFDNKVRFNLTGFYYNVDDIQLNGNDANGNGVLFNADKAQAYGVEAELNIHPVRNLALSFGASWLHTEIKDKRVYAQACALNGVLVCTVNDPMVTRTVFGAPAYFAQIDGNPLPNAPEYNLNATARYDVPVSDSGKVFIATDWNLQGYTNYVLYKTDEFYSNGNFEGGLKIGYTGGNGRWEVAAFARNITNEKNLKGVIENYMAAVLNEPRVIGVSLTGRTR